MAVYRNGETGQVSRFIQEPEDEMAAIRFIALRKGQVCREAVRALDAHVTLAQQALDLGLKGGYMYELTPTNIL